MSSKSYIFLGVFLCVASAHAQTLRDVRETTFYLSSPDPAQQQMGRAAVARHGIEFLRLLIAELESGEPSRIDNAALHLHLLVSPW